MSALPMQPDGAARSSQLVRVRRGELLGGLGVLLRLLVRLHRETRSRDRLISGCLCPAEGAHGFSVLSGVDPPYGDRRARGDGRVSAKGDPNLGRSKRSFSAAERPIASRNSRET